VNLCHVPDRSDRSDVHSEELVKAAVGINESGTIRYNTTAYNITGCIEPGSDGINHSELAKLSFTLVIFVD